jgi:hypothetical protein
LSEEEYIKYQVISFDDSKSLPIVIQKSLPLHDAIEYCLAGIRQFSSESQIPIRSVLESHSHTYGLTFAALGPVLSKKELEEKLEGPIDDSKEQEQGLELKGGGMVHQFWQVVQDSLKVEDLTGEELYLLFQESCRRSTGEDPSWEEVGKDHWQHKPILH